MSVNQYSFSVTVWQISVSCIIVFVQTTELTSLKRDLDKQKEQASAADMKIKWNENKLKAEQDTHKVFRVTAVALRRLIQESCITVYPHLI